MSRILKVAITIFFCIQGTIQHEIIPRLNLTKHVTYTKCDFLINYKIEKNVTFSYARCHYNIERRKCILTLETLNSNGTSDTKSCTIRMHINKHDKLINKKYALVQLDYDNVIFVWNKNVKIGKDNFQYAEILKVRVIRMSTCRHKDVTIKTSKVNFDDNSNEIDNLHVVTYENGGFDLFYNNERLCGNYQQCKLNYNPQNKSFTDPIPFLHVKNDEELIEVHTIMSNKTSNRLAYVIHTREKEGDDEYVELLDPNGKLILKHNYERNSLIGTLHRATSYVAEALGICEIRYPTDKFVRCSLYDSIGNEMLGIEITTKSLPILILNMHNLPNGGFLLFIGYASRKGKHIYDIDILNIDKYGMINTTYEMISQCTSSLKVHVFERKGYDLCFHLACSWENIEKHNETIGYNLRISTECYSSSIDYSEEE